MSDRQFERAVTDWLEDGTDRTPERAIDGVLLAVKTTPQERDLRIPWRFAQMPVLNRAVGIAAVALVVLVGAGSLIFLSGRAPSGAGGAPTASMATSAPTTAPTGSPTPAPSEVAPGITAWVPYTSAVYGYTLAYPAGWNHQAAKRAWEPGEGNAVAPGTTDHFLSPDRGASVSVSLWPAGEDADLESIPGLKAWAETYCSERVLPGCDTFAERAERRCRDVGGMPCRPAIIIPGDEGEYAFFPDWSSLMQTDAPDKVTVVFVPSGDAFPGTARYGGSVRLLESFLSTMGVSSSVNGCC